MSSIYEVKEDRERLIAELWLLIGSLLEGYDQDVDVSDFPDPSLQEAINIMLDRDEIPVLFTEAIELIGKGKIVNYRVEPNYKRGVPSGLTRVILLGKGFVARDDSRTNQIFFPI